MYLGFQRALHKTPHNVLIFKIKPFGIADNVYNWIKGIKSSFVINGVCSRLITYICDVDVGLNHFIGKFVDDTSIGNTVISDRDKKLYRNSCAKSFQVTNAFLTSLDAIFFMQE